MEASRTAPGTARRRMCAAPARPSRRPAECVRKWTSTPMQRLSSMATCRAPTRWPRRSWRVGEDDAAVAASAVSCLCLRPCPVFLTTSFTCCGQAYCMWRGRRAFAELHGRRHFGPWARRRSHRVRHRLGRRSRVGQVVLADAQLVGRVLGRDGLRQSREGQERAETRGGLQLGCARQVDGHGERRQLPLRRGRRQLQPASPAAAAAQLREVLHQIIDRDVLAARHALRM
eukprot:SAG25_NODE_187_length_12399_cov_42.588537_2_plen_230_part_00